jgi:radial spoke head protein 4A
MAQDFESAKAYLQKSTKDGQTLYDHLTNVLLQLTKETPEDPVAAFEALSVQMKRAALSVGQGKELPHNPTTSVANGKILASCDATSALLRGPDPSLLPPINMPVVVDEDEEEDEEKKPEPVQGHVPDMMTDASMLEWAGVNLGQEEVYKIMLSLRKLAAERGLASVRFFGKIFGTQSDYLIAETKLMVNAKESPEVLLQTKKEPSGKGANEYVYFAANTAGGKWRRLPDVLPEQIITARLMKRFFTGDLDAPVKGYPRFGWTEASYLRAQLARIAASTAISPKGFYTTDEVEVEGEEDETEEIMVEDAEFEAPEEIAEMADPEGWAHHVKYLTKQGRTENWVAPEREDDEDEEDEEDEEEEEEEVPERLAGLEEDTLKGVGSGWNFRILPKNSAASVACCYSTIWPGAVTVCKGKLFANSYVGWGQKYSPTLYTPPPPPTVQTEYVSSFDPEEAEEDEVDPMVEMTDPQPPKELPDEGENEGDEGDDDDDDDDDEEDDE